MKKVLRKLVQGVVFGIAVATSVVVPRAHAQTGNAPSANLGVSLGSPLIEGSLVTRTVQLNQTEVRSTVVEALKKLREEMWDVNPNYNGKKLQEVAKEAGLTTKELYATGMKWDQTLEKKAIQRATESSIIAAHKRLDLSQYDIGYENLAWGYSVESAIVNGWGYGELDSLNTAKGQFNADNGHLHTQLNPYLLSFGVANINGVTAGVYNHADSKDLNGTDLTGNYAVTLKVANELTEVKGTLVYRGNTALIPAVAGLIKHTDGQTYYVENGEVKASFTGLADVVVSNGESNCGVHALQVKTAYIHDGKFNSSISGIVVLNNKELVYLTNGFVNKAYVGVVSYGNQSYKVKNGKVDGQFTGLVQSAVNKGWFYVRNGEIDWKFTGLVQHSNGGWFYVQNGKIAWNYTGFVQHTNQSWFYVKNGKIDWKFTGLLQNNGKWSYVREGKVARHYSGLVQHTNKAWYYVRGGDIDWVFTGLVQHINGNWYYVKNGKIAWNYTGTVLHNNQKRRVVNGKLI